MKKVDFFNIRCIGIKLESERTIEKLGVFEYTNSNLEYGRRQQNMKFAVVKEDEIAEEYLKNGKGVYYKGYVYFKEENHKESEQYKKLVKKLVRIQNGRTESELNEHQTYLNGALYYAISNPSHFAMVKSMITLYESKIFTYEILIKKLETYLKPDGIEFVLNELHQSVEKAG